MDKTGPQRPQSKRVAIAPSTTFPYKSIPLQKIIAREDEVINALVSPSFESPFVTSKKRAKKPVILHSLRVGFWLMTRGYPTPVIVPPTFMMF